jgi:hypothetical protein
MDTITKRQWLIIFLFATAWALLFGSTAAWAAPDPVQQNGVKLVGFDGRDFRYAVTLTANTAGAETAPDCRGTAIVSLCGRHVTSVTGLPATWDANSVTITDVPVGVSHFTVHTDDTFNARSVTWALRADDRSYSGSTEGPDCTPTAVALSGLSADVDGLQAQDLMWLALLGAALLMVRELRRGKR